MSLTSLSADMKLHLIAATVLLYSLLAVALIALSEAADYWTTFP